MDEQINRIVEFSLPAYGVYLLACPIIGCIAVLIVTLLICVRRTEQATALRRRLDRQARQLDRAAESEQEKAVLGRRLAHAEGKLAELTEALRGVWQ